MTRRHSVSGYRPPGVLVRRAATLFAIALLSACELLDCTGPDDLFDITGLVTINELPAAGVEVRALGESVETAEDGRFRLTVSSDARPIIVVIVPPDGVRFRTESTIVTALPAQDIHFDGYREAAIHGTVLGDGTGLPGATVELTGAGVERTTTSAEDGAYRFDAVPPTFILPYLLRVTDGPPEFTYHNGGQGVFVNLLGEDAVHDLIVTPDTTVAPGTAITGTVRVNGNPIGDLLVRLGGAAEATRVTDSAGRYTFAELTPGTYTVSITNPFPGVSFPALSYTVDLAAGQTVIVDFTGTS